MGCLLTGRSSFWGNPALTKAAYSAWWGRSYFGGVPAGAARLSGSRATGECSGKTSSASKADGECKNCCTQASG